MKSKSLRLLALLCCLPLLAACGSTESSVQSSSSSIDSSSSTSVDDSTSSSSSDDDDLPSVDDEGGDDDDEGNTGEGDDDEGDDSGDTTTAPYSSAQDVWDDLAELADTYPYLTGASITSSTVSNYSSGSSSSSTTVDVTINSQEVYIEEDTDGTELQSYYGIQDDVYYSLSRLGAAYPSGSRQKITDDNKESIEATLEETAADYGFSSFLYGNTYGLGVTGLSLYDGFSEVFTDEIINGTGETETLSEDEVEDDDTETGDTDTGDDDGETEDGDGEDDGEDGEVVEPWVPQEAITNFQITYSDFYGSWIFQINSYSEGTYYCSELTLTGYVSDDGTLTSLTMIRDRYIYGSTWDEVNHAPVESASPSTSWTLSLSNLEFATELPEAGSSYLLSNPSQYYMTEYTAYLPGTTNWITGVRTDDNTVNVGDTVGTFSVYEAWDDVSSSYVYECQPSNAVDRNGDIYMVAKGDGSDYTYFKEDPSSGNWVVTLPEGTDKSTFEGDTETVTVSNGFVTSEVTLTIEGTATSSSGDSNSADIAGIYGVYNDGATASVVSGDIESGGNEIYVRVTTNPGEYFYITVRSTNTAPFDFSNITVTDNSGLLWGSEPTFFDNTTGDQYQNCIYNWIDETERSYYWGIECQATDSSGTFSFNDGRTYVNIIVNDA